jgi:hypothetical protein
MEQRIIFAEQGILSPEQGIGPGTNFLSIRGEERRKRVVAQPIAKPVRQ